MCKQKDMGGIGCYVKTKNAIKTGVFLSCFYKIKGLWNGYRCYPLALFSRYLLGQFHSFNPLFLLNLIPMTIVCATPIPQ